MGEAKRRKKLDANFGKGGKGFGRQEEKKQSPLSSSILSRKNTVSQKSSTKTEIVEKKDSKLADKYTNLIGNPQWHSWEIPEEDWEKLKQNTLGLKIPEAIKGEMLNSIKQEHRETVEIIQRLASIVLEEETVSPDNPNIGGEVTEIVKELGQMILADSSHSIHEDRNSFSVNEETINRTKSLGLRLNELGGSNLMVTIANKFVPPCDRKELEYLWDGIGDWKV